LFVATARDTIRIGVLFQLNDPVRRKGDAMNRLFTAIGVAALMVAVGCDWGQSVQKAGDDVKDATKTFQTGMTDSSKNLQQGITDAAKSLQTGIEKFDAIGLKRLLDENSDLRKSVEILQGRLATLPSGQGVIDLAGRPLQFMVAQYRGGFKVNGYVDTPENQFWVDKVLSRNDLKLGFEIGQYFASLPPSVKFFMGNVLDIKYTNVARHANQGVESTFQAFLKNPGFIPRADDSTIDLNSQLGSGSLHKLVVVVTPTEADATNKWSLRGKVILKSGINIEILKEVDLGSDLTPGHQIGHPLPPVTLLLMVKKSAKSD
jgi:hypothetical protein